MPRLSLLSLCLVSSLSWATAQIPDTIVIDGVEHEFVSGEPLQSKIEQAMETDEQFAASVMGNLCSAAWRGYRAHFLLRDDTLHLAEPIKLGCGDEQAWPNTLPERTAPVAMTWFSGQIVAVASEPMKVNGTVWVEGQRLSFKEGEVLSVEPVPLRSTRWGFALADH